MTKLVTTPSTRRNIFRTPEDVIDFLNDAFESGHLPYIATTLGISPAAKA